MQARIAHHYIGSNPHSFLPILRLEIDGDHGQLSNLIESPSALAQALGETAEAKRFLNRLGCDQVQYPEQADAWLVHWFDSLLRWSGLVQIDQITSCCQQDPLEPNRFKQSLLINCFRYDLDWFLSVLSWSNDCFSFVTRQYRDQRQATALQQRFLSLRRAPIKDSFMAMANHLARQRMPFFVSYLSNNYWLHVGLGCRKRQFSQKLTSTTSATGLHKAKDKQLSRMSFFEAGLPIAAGGTVVSLEEAQRLSQQIGYPVVLKPVAQDQGIGVFTLISNEKQLQQAWSVVGQHGPRVLVEKHISGRDFRFLLVNGRLMASLERIPGGVVGDGVNPISLLIDRENQRRALNPIRTEAGLELRLIPLALDDEALTMLAKQGLTSSSIPRCDQVVSLRYTANFSRGGSVRECGSEIHPFNVFLLEKAVSVFQLDIAGLDVIAESLEQPLPTSGGVICEINGMPGVLPHLLAEPSRALMAEVSDMLFDSGPTVPIVMVHGRGSSSFIKRLEEQALPAQPQLLTASRDGLSQSGHLLRPIDASRITVQLNALQDPSATAFLMELNGKQLAAYGVASPKIDLLILGDSEDDPLSQEVRSWLCTYASEVLEVGDLGSSGSETASSLALTKASAVLGS